MKKILVEIHVVMVAMLMVLLVSCVGESTSEYETEARERAVVAAKELIQSNHNNVFEMERMILKAKAVQSEYMLKGDTVAVRAFDESFREYVQAHDAKLASELF